MLTSVGAFGILLVDTSAVLWHLYCYRYNWRVDGIDGKEEGEYSVCPGGKGAKLEA